MIYEMREKVSLIHHVDYGTRLLFLNGPTNPRDKLGKNGVSIHTVPSAWCVSIRLDLQDETGAASATVFHINRKSLIKYLGLDLSRTITDNDLIDALTSHLKDQDFLKKTSLRHAGEQHHRPLKWSLLDAIKASFLGKLYQWSIQSIQRIWVRFALVRREKDLLEAGEILAKQRFHEAKGTVPAYQEHLKGHTPKSLKDVPPTSKENYIKVQEFDANTHRYGRYPKKHKTDTSTGTTGNPTEWVRGEAELESVAATLRLSSKITLGDRPLFFVNAFALGPWATGLTTYEMMRDVGSVFATGPDKEKILGKLLTIRKEDKRQLMLSIIRYQRRCSTLSVEDANQIAALIDKAICQSPDEATLNQVLGRVFQEENCLDLFKEHRMVIRRLAKTHRSLRSQVIIAGYPPFLKDLIDYAKQKGYDFHEFAAMGVVGGQGISEAMRDQLVQHGFSKVYSSYGASDLDINIGAESDYEIKVRKFLETHPDVARELYGENKGLPMIFHYDPMNYHIECDNSDELLLTCTRDDRSSLRVAYDLGDKGRVYAASTFQAVLHKHGFFVRPKINLPMLLVWGRDATVVFNGANLEFTELERVLTDHEVLSQKVLKKAFYTYHDAEGCEKLEIWLELKEGENLPLCAERESNAQYIFSQLVRANQDLRYQVEKLAPDVLLPTIRYFKRGESPISEAGGHRKQVLIFHEKNLPENYRVPEDEEKCVSFALPKGKLHQPLRLGL